MKNIRLAWQNKRTSFFKRILRCMITDRPICG